MPHPSEWPEKLEYSLVTCVTDFMAAVATDLTESGQQNGISVKRINCHPGIAIGGLSATKTQKVKNITHCNVKLILLASLLSKAKIVSHYTNIWLLIV